MDEHPMLIALDWGTSSLRAFLVGAGGAVLDRSAKPLGILNLPPGGFRRVFAETVDGWLSKHPGLPAIASGMIGSRQGWQEAPYLPCPSGLEELARGLLPVATGGPAPLWIVPGVMREAPGMPPDVMRGEETQILGSTSAADGAGPRAFVLPGTHSKWALVERGRIAWFATFMTGELYGVLRQHSILGRLMEGERPDDAAFRRGVAHAAEAAGGGLLHKLFSVRTLALFERLAREGAAAYLSGLLIGSEIVEARACIAEVLGALPDAVTVIGEDRLGRLYADALARYDMAARLAPEDTVVRGLFRLASAAGLVGAG